MEDQRRSISRIIVLALLYVTLVLLIAWRTGPFFYHFAGLRLVTLYSLFQLSATAFAAFAASKALGKERTTRLYLNPASRPFYISGWGFLFLAFDEIFSIHENLDKLIHFVFSMRVTSWSDHIDDFIVFLYGLIAIFFIKEFIAEFRRRPYMLSLIGVGMVFFFIMFCMDYITNNFETFMEFVITEFSNGDLVHKCDVGRMIEDSMKLLGEAFLLSAFAGALVHIRSKKS
ncbi:MAG: hypothetical protein JW800_08300 [Candidatus Omnitrophica bacterium]|nr:hypothetical protein [Candidatus Omnitrophota bacterium]